MKLLLHTRFYPNVGGVETVAGLLAQEWNRMGVNVTVMTDVPKGLGPQTDFPFAVYHQPSSAVFFRLVRENDAFLHFNISLRALWPLLFVRRPLIASHHGFYIVDRTHRRDWREKLKLQIAKRTSANIAASEAIARELGAKCNVIPNPYDDSLFTTGVVDEQRGDVVFAGRLVSDKGGDLLLKALAILGQRNQHPKLTVVGDGPELGPLQELSSKLGLKAHVTFVGKKIPADVAEEFRRHRVAVVPSLIAEGFGMVAIEAIACGCVVVGSNAGGLPEAIGPCGLTFEQGNATDLANKIEMLLGDAELRHDLQLRAAERLAKHRPSAVATRYADVIEGVISKHG